MTVETMVAIVTTVLASSGFWAYMLKRHDNKSASNKMLIGLAHDRIKELAIPIIDRGYITHFEYENLHDYLFVPYKELGGNGTAQKLITEINKLPTKKGENENDIKQ